MRATDRLKRLSAPFLYYTGLVGVHRRLESRRSRAPGVTVLVFHRVLPDGQTRSPLGTRETTFRHIVDFLRRRCRVVPMAEAVRGIQTGSLPERAVVITFDDGYRDSALVAGPVLAAAGLPWTLFLTAAYAGTSRLLWWDLVTHAATHGGERDFLAWARATLAEIAGAAARPRGPATTSALVDALKTMPDRARRRFVRRLERRLGLDAGSRRRGRGPAVSAADLARDRVMSWDEARALAQSGVEIGAHSLTHPILPRASPRVRRHEIEGARWMIERRLGRRVGYFAYPNNDVDDACRAVVARAGYAAAFVGERRRPRSDLDLLRLPRRSLWVFAHGGAPFSPALMEAELGGVFARLGRLVGR